MSELHVGHFKRLNYLLYLPNDYDKTKRYPVFFHLHGAGGRGTDFQAFQGSVILDLINKGNTPLNNAICVIPQCPSDTWFDVWEDLLGLAQDIYRRTDVDKARFNGSGISMGGYGLYQLIMCLPELFHNAIVCCGGGQYWNAARMKNIHFRIFHGEQDTAVYPEEAKRMASRLLEAETDAVLTLYPDCDHDCWNKTYRNLKNLEWLIS